MSIRARITWVLNKTKERRPRRTCRKRFSHAHRGQASLISRHTRCNSHNRANQHDVSDDQDHDGSDGCRYQRKLRTGISIEIPAFAKCLDHAAERKCVVENDGASPPRKKKIPVATPTPDNSNTIAGVLNGGL